MARLKVIYHREGTYVSLAQELLDIKMQMKQIFSKVDSVEALSDYPEELRKYNRLLDQEDSVLGALLLGKKWFDLPEGFLELAAQELNLQLAPIPDDDE